MYFQNNFLYKKKKKTNLENLLKVSCNFEKDLLFEPLSAGLYLGQITSGKQVDVQNGKCPNRDI